MKKKNLLIVSLAVTIALLSSVGCKSEEQSFEPWDNLGGGGVGTDFTDYSDVTASEYLIEELINDNSSGDYAYDESENCYKIDLNGLNVADLSGITAYSYKNNELKIKAGGVFVLSGNFSGSVTVNDTTESVRIVLDGVNIRTTDEQNCAAIVFKKPDGETISERILTVKENTVNILSDSTGDDSDGDGAVIQAKKRSLTVNGKGTLKLNCKGEKTSGLKVKTSLVINGPVIEVSDAVKSGIKADELIVVKNANIKISSDGDGMKTDIEPSTDEDAKNYASDGKYGYTYIENSDFDVTAGDDGFSANNCIYIANNDNNLIKIKTNGGAPSSVTEYSSDNADGKAIKVEGIEFNDTKYSAGYNLNYGLVITGGNFELDSNDDAITSKGNVIISDGTFEISTGDDGIHAEYLLKIIGGDVTVKKSYEGIEGATVEILGGKLDVTAFDDGINAANSDLGRYAFYILIAGGDITVNAGGDGVDSNGTIKIIGGNLYVYGPTANDNAALDADSGIIIVGGNVCAVGSAGMVENPSENSSQCYVSLTLTSSAVENTEITIKNSDGELLLQIKPPKKYQSVIVSLSEFVKGETYTISVGDQSYSATLNSIGTALGRNMQGGGNQGFRPDGNQGFKPDGKPDGRR